jgi:hypothetical protein
MKKLCFILLTSLLLVIGGGISAQDTEDIETLSCVIQNENPIDIQSLPDNMRFLISVIGDENVLYLVNPKNNSQQPIPNSKGWHPTLFNDATKLMLFWHFEYQGKVEIATMELDGTNRNTILELEAGDVGFGLGASLTDNRILFGHGGLFILDIMSGDIETLEEPELHAIEELSYLDTHATSPEDVFVTYHRYFFDGAARQVAYWAYQAGEDGAYLYTEPLVLRIQNLETDEFIDIEPSLLQGAHEFDWYGSTERIYVMHGRPTDPNFKIFDTADGHLIGEVEPPMVFKGWSSQTISESPDGRLLAVYYGSHQRIAGIYDLYNHQWLPSYCFEIPSGYAVSGYTINWTPDGHYIWWVECDNLTRRKCNLVMVDIETGAYGIVAEDINERSRIGFIDDE